MLDKYGIRIGISDVKAMSQEARCPEVMKKIVDTVHSDDPVEARNAAWVMTHFTDEQVMMLMPRQNEFIDLILTTGNSSLRRLLLNIIERQEIKEENLRTDFLDFCLEHTSSPTEQPGIQSLCMKLAYRQCRFYPELMEEFRNMLQLMQDGYAKSVMGLRRKFLSAKPSFL